MRFSGTIKNETDRPGRELRSLILYGLRDLNAHRAEIRVIEAIRSNWLGKPHPSGYAWKYTDRGQGRILLRIPTDTHYPYDGWQRHRSSPWNHDYRDWREAVVALAAHEGKHIDLTWDYYRDHSKHVIEMACEAHERWVLDRFRE